VSAASAETGLEGRISFVASAGVLTPAVMHTMMVHSDFFII